MKELKLDKYGFSRYNVQVQNSMQKSRKCLKNRKEAIEEKENAIEGDNGYHKKVKLYI